MDYVPAGPFKRLTDPFTAQQWPTQQTLMTAESAIPNPVSEIENIERVAQMHLEWVRKQKPPQREG